MEGPKKRLQSKALRGENLAFEKPIAGDSLRFRGFPRGQGLCSDPLHSTSAALCVCVAEPMIEVTENA